jgi:Glycosyl transferase family 90
MRLIRQYRSLPKFVACSLLFGLFLFNFDALLAIYSSEFDVDKPENVLADETYSTASIAAMVQILDFAPARLMIYDPSGDQFLWYSIAPKEHMLIKANHCGSCSAPMKLLLRSLLQNYPDRFVIGQPPFQMLISDADFSYFNSALLLSINANIGSEGKSSSISIRAPMLQFGSVMKDVSILPSVQVYPFDPYLLCLDEWHFHRYDVCQNWVMDVIQNVTWDSLIPQLIWRGRLYKFLETLDVSFFNKENMTHLPYYPFSPRERINEMSKAASQDKSNMDGNLPWLNACAFHVLNYKKCYVSKLDISKYRYQLDLGGAGGTSWTGTLEKLMMPGVLFHHETPAKDWYYDRLVPWKHYIPIKTDLSNLRDRYEWAVKNDKKAKQISKSASLFARNILSKEAMEMEHNLFFGNNSIVAKLPKMYLPSIEETAESILKTYRTIHKLHITGPFATCDKNSCMLKYGKKRKMRYPFKIWG